MSLLVENLFTVLYLLAVVGGIGWWLWVVRRSRHPAKPKRTQTDDAELARLRAHLAQLEGEPGAKRFPQ